MKMHDVEFADSVMECPAKSWRPIKSSNQGTREILDLNPVKIHRRRDGSGSNPWPVDVSCKDLHFVASCRQRSAEAMDRKKRPPMVHSGEIGRNDMEDSHCPNSTENRPYSDRCDQPAKAKNGPNEPLIQCCADAVMDAAR